VLLSLSLLTCWVSIVSPVAARAASMVGAGTVENTSSDITYTGSWTSATSSSDSAGSTATLTSTGYAQIAFKETSVRWVARTGNFYGIANVYLDGTQVATVDLYSPTNTYKTTVWTSPALSYTNHTLRIERSGNKNSASTGRTVNLDSLVVADTRAPAAPTGLTAVPDSTGAKLSWTATNDDALAGYLVYRATGTSTSYQPLTPDPVTDTTYTDPALTPNTSYRYQISAIDRSSNESPRTNDASVTANYSAVGAGTVENTSSDITYTGSWTSATSSSDSAGSTATLTSTGYAQIAFKETSVRWVARTGNFYGIANVYLDGTQVATVDLYSPTNTYKTTVWTSPALSYTNHTLRIERSGNKNSASTGRTVNLDSLVVADTRAPAAPTGLTAVPDSTGAKLSWTATNDDALAGYLVYRATGTSTSYQPLTPDPVTDTTYTDPALTPNTSYRYQISAIDRSSNESPRTNDAKIRSTVGPGTYEGDDEAVARSGPWTSEAAAAASGGSVETIAESGSASLTFLETNVRWVGPTGPDLGIAVVFLDGARIATVDQYSSKTVNGVTLFETKDLSAGGHTIKVTRTDGKNSSSTAATPSTSVDSFVVKDTTAPKAPETVSAEPSGSGVQVSWSSSLDDDTAGYLLHRAKGASSVFEPVNTGPLVANAFFDDNLDAGTTYRYQVTALDSDGNESTASSTAQATTAVSTGTVENTSPAVVYSTPWATSSSTRDSGGSYATLSVPGSAQLTFSGTGIKWVTRTNNFSGIAQVYVDDAPVAKVDLYSATQAYQQVVFSRLSLADGRHSIRIERTGTLNPASSGRLISLDSFVVLDSLAPPAMSTPVLTASSMGIKVTWEPSPAGDVAAYRLYRTGPSDDELLLDRLPLSQLSFLDVGLVDSTLYSYRVTALDTSGNESPSSSQASLRTPAPAPPVAERYASCPGATRTVSTTGQLHDALSQAAPGTVIKMVPGTYAGNFSLTASGTAARPIWICGPRDAVVDFGDIYSGYGFYLKGSSYVNLTGMAVRNVQKGVQVLGATHVTVSDVALDAIGDEAIHLRGNTTDSTVIGNVISGTGRSTAAYGEGVYVGSDPDAWCTYSQCNPDRSDRNQVLDNTMSQTTAEGVDAKAGTSDGRIAGNVIDGAQMSAASSGGWIVIKGNGWLVKSNTGRSAPADGFAATYSKADGWGRSNVFVSNTADVANPTGFGVWVQSNLGNLVGCDNTTPDGQRTSNVVCQR